MNRMIAACKKHGTTKFCFIKHKAYCELCLEEQSGGIISGGRVVLPKDFKPGPVPASPEKHPFSMGCEVASTPCPDPDCEHVHGKDP